MSKTSRIMVATKRKRKKETVVLRDELPALQKGEVRIAVDKFGLSTNNVFYAQMGEAPLLKFFHVYPLEKHKDLVNVPAWGLGTIIESENPEFNVGERYRGFFHMTNVVQMKAKRSSDGLVAIGGSRDKLNKAYNRFVRVSDGPTSPFTGGGSKPDLAMIAAPGALSGFVIYELLRMKNYYGGNSVVLTSASSKLSLATAVCLQEARANGTIKKVIGYTSAANAEFVQSTGLFDGVLTYDQSLSSNKELQFVMIDVAGDAAIFQRNKKHLKKALAVGGTHSNAKASTFAAFGPSGLAKMVSGMMAPKSIACWVDSKLNPKLEMFFAPSVMAVLMDKFGKEEFEKMGDAALNKFVIAAIDNGWISVVRGDEPEAIQASYDRVFRGKLPPSEAVILSLANAK